MNSEKIYHILQFEDLVNLSTPNFWKYCSQSPSKIPSASKEAGKFHFAFPMANWLISLNSHARPGQEYGEIRSLDHQ